MKKIGLILLSVLCVAMVLFVGSCTNNNSGLNNVVNGGNKTDSKLHLEIVFGDEAYREYALDLGFRISRAYGNKFSVAKIGKESSDKFKIILGSTDYEQSGNAYRYFSEIIDVSSNDMTGFAMYYSDNIVAIAFNNVLDMNMAGDYLVENIAQNLPNYQKGYIAAQAVKTLDYLEEKRNEYHDGELAKAAEKLDEETITELKNLLNIYGPDIYIWLANLWDPDVGGFYYSQSARDTEGFLPDLESTAQAFALIDSSGLMANYENSYVNALTNDAKEKLTSWVQGMQSSTNGYFYHPQWGTNIADARRGRDLDWATRILKALGQKPLYNTPNGMAGSLGAPGVAPTSVTESLQTDSVVVAAKVVTTASTSGLPSYLQDPVQWRQYLEALNITAVGNSYPRGHALASIASQIKAAGQEYVDIFVDFINEKQNPNTGLWEPGVTYEGVNGLMKISVAMRDVGHTIQYADKALQSAIDVALKRDFTTGNEHVCSVYNPWVAMNNTLSAVSGARREELRALIIEQAPELLVATREKFNIFAKYDGGFSYYKDYSARISQGQIVAVDKSKESDVNATGVSTTSTWSNICGVLGIDKINLFCPEDGDYFITLFDGMGSIVKDEEINYDGIVERVATFTEGETQTYYLTNSLGIPGGKTITDSDYKAILEPNYTPITRYDVVSSPTDEENNVLRVVCDKSSLYSGGQTSVGISNKGPIGSCYSVNFKLYYTDILNSGDVMQIHFRTAEGNAVSVSLYADTKTGTIKMKQNNATGTGKDEISVVIMPMNEWVELTIEFYKTNVAATSMLKVYVGTEGREPECLAAVNAYQPSGLNVDSVIDRVALAHQRTNGSTVYLDDISFSRIEKEFTPAPPRPEIADFENVNSSGDDIKDYVTNNMLNGELTYITVDKDPKNPENNALKVVGQNGGVGGTSTNVEISNAGAGTTYTYETKLYFTGLSTTLHEDILQLFLNDMSGGTAVRAVGYGFKPTSDGKQVLLYGRNSVTGGTGNGAIQDPDGNTIAFNVDTWYTLRIEYYAGGTAETAMTKIYVGVGDAEPTLVAEARVYRDCTLTSIARVNMSWQKYNTEYTVYADDISFKASNKAYVAELEYDFEENPGSGSTPVTPPAVNSAETFENDDEAIYVDRNYSVHCRYTTGHVGFIAVDPTDAANKVLKIQRVANATARAELFAQAVITEENASTYVFTTSLYFTAPEYIDAEFLCFTFMSGGGRAAPADIALATKSTDTGKVFLKFGSQYVDSTMKSETWYDIKVELIDLGSGKGKTEFYVAEKGQTLVKIAEFAHDSGVGAADKMRIWVYENTPHSNAILFDNVLFACRAAGSTGGENPPVNPPSAANGGESFEEADTGLYLDKSNAVYYETTSGSATPAITTDPANAANKVLSIGNGSSSQQRAFANLSKTTEGANHFTFFTKIYLAKPVNSSKELIRFNFLGITGPSQITLNTVYNDNALKAFVKYNTTFATYADSSKVVLDYGAWYDFQIELIITDNSTGAAKIKISVAKSGEDLVSIFEQDVTITSGTKTPTQVRIQRTSGTANTAVYFDDVILYGKNS